MFRFKIRKYNWTSFVIKELKVILEYSCLKITLFVYLEDGTTAFIQIVNHEVELKLRNINKLEFLKQIFLEVVFFFFFF